MAAHVRRLSCSRMLRSITLLPTARFLSGLADNALLVVTIARLLELQREAWLAPLGMYSLLAAGHWALHVLVPGLGAIVFACVAWVMLPKPLERKEPRT